MVHGESKYSFVSFFPTLFLVGGLAGSFHVGQVKMGSRTLLSGMKVKGL